MKEKEITKYKQQVDNQFNSENNWSTLISHKNNDMRNSIMQNLKLQQIKRRKLREFLRQSKETIIGNRGSTDFKDSMLKEKEMLNKDEKDVALKKQNVEYNTEYKQYFTDTLTKGNGKAQGGNPDNAGGMNQSNSRYPKQRNKEEDSVEAIAANVQ